VYDDHTHDDGGEKLPQLLLEILYANSCCQDI
jgi:hypothetical protein